MLIAAGRLNTPAIVVSGGPVEADCLQGTRVCHTDLIEAEALVENGKMSRDELAEFEQVANPGAGSWAMMGTANTVNMLTEAIGMTLTDGAVTPATYGAWLTGQAT
jgi:dihydroxy-acid dehydratase